MLIDLIIYFNLNEAFVNFLSENKVASFAELISVAIFCLNVYE